MAEYSGVGPVRLSHDPATGKRTIECWSEPKEPGDRIGYFRVGNMGPPLRHVDSTVYARAEWAVQWDDADPSTVHFTGKALTWQAGDVAIPDSAVPVDLTIITPTPQIERG